MKRPGFTLLEVMLASLIGAIVLALCGALLFAGSRTEATLAARTEQTSDLGRARVVMNRVFSSLLMVNRRADARSTAARLGVTGRAGSEGDKPDAGAESLPYTPRLILEPDPALAGLVMTPRALRTDGPVQPQRLEVVVTDSPVPQSAGGEQVLRLLGVRSRSGPRRAAKAPTDGAASDQAAADSADGASTPGETDAQSAALADDAQTTVRAVRGAFEFWPQSLEGRRGESTALESLGSAGESPTLWELWWVPMAPKPRRVGEPAPEVARALGEPYLIAKNIRFARWIAFKNRQHSMGMSSAADVDLPAYVEFEVETAAGLKSEWMFEIGWASGPETPPPPAETTAGAGSAIGRDGNAPGGTPAIKDAPVVGSGSKAGVEGKK